MDCRTESKVGDASRAFGEIGRDGFGDRDTEVIAKSKRLKVGDRKDSRADKAANGGCFKSGIVGAARNVTKSRNEFGGTVEWSMLDEQIREKIEATGFEIGGGLNSRGRGHKKFDGIRGATEDEASKSCRR